MHFYVCGGGCYGTYYLRQLRKAAAKGRLDVDGVVIVDRDPECAASSMLAGDVPARLWVASWEDLGGELWERRDSLAKDMWVPAPIAPHVVFHWARDILSRAHRRTATQSYEGPLPSLPFADTIRDGTLVLSHAPGVCPTNCIEPAKCPLTGGARDWEMRETVRCLIAEEYSGHGIDEVAIVTCQHLEFGVGTIPFAQIFSEIERLSLAALTPGCKVAVATVSSCHGILDTFRFDG